MKKLILFILGLVAYAASTYAGNSFSECKGVWASDDAEAVITDSVCIYFAKADSSMQATLEIPSLQLIHQTTFDKNGTVTSTNPSSSLEISKADNEITINGRELKKVEDIQIVGPYEMMECKYRLDIGKCLQQWRLGVKYGVQGDMPYCEINTNRHMFVYLLNPNMVYIRAAATRNNNAGTLFFQNIRMMKNQNTGEYTTAIEPNNFSAANDDLEIDNSKFNPNTCTFSPDGGIYWSVISFEPNQILLNGCGETYHITRTEIDAPLNEWIQYESYTGQAEFSVERMKEAFK